MADDATPAASASACPVDHKNLKSHPLVASSAAPGENGCSYDPRTNLPALSNQPQADQRDTLPLDREHSSIPRTDGGVWVYPSQQMFFNAMKRKQWDPSERDMGVVVPIHNAVNEMAWHKILEWERLEDAECKTPTLTKFTGRPKDISPKARVRSWMGYTLPFDRHDWTVNRCGTDVNYVIDFYSGKADAKAVASFYLDVRPKLDTWEGVKMRVKGAWRDITSLAN
ncbi:Cytochrome c1 heme lyase [Sorochytrium milnesiophthora]